MVHQARPRAACLADRHGVDSRTAPVVGDRDRPHAAQRIAAIGGAGGHDFRAGWRDDGRDALSVPSPPPAGRRGSRDPEPDDNALGHAAAGLAGRGTGTDVGVTGLAARPRSPFKRHHAAPSCGRGRRAMAGRAVRARESQVRTRRRLSDAGGGRDGEEPEPSEVAGGVHALREQRVDLGVLEREVAGDADAVRDVDAEVVGREVERPRATPAV